MLAIFLSILGGAVLIFVLVLGGMMLPTKSCSVEWLDSEIERFQGPFSTCPDKLKIHEVGGEEYVQFGSHVYAVRHGIRIEPAGFPCMIGVTCFPIPQGRKTWESYTFIRLDGPIQLTRLKSYLDDYYVSDGNTIFAGFKRVPATMPPIDPARLQWLPCMRTDEGSRCETYATDGAHVLEREKIVQGADPASFKDDLPALTLDGKLESSPFARDRTSVYAYGKRIDGAEAETFSVLKTDQIIGFDQKHAWRAGVDDVDEVHLSPDELRQVRINHETAWATRRARD